MSARQYLCVSGTDTDSGKTVICAGLLRAALDLGADVQAVKPVQSGCSGTGSGPCRPFSTPGPTAFQGAPAFSGPPSFPGPAPDVGVYLEAAPGARACAIAALDAPCSPHLAARKQGLELDARTLAAEMSSFLPKSRHILVEGAGGVMAPLNDRETMADLFVQLRGPVILIVPGRLGAINHALLSIEVLRSKGLNLAGFIVNNPEEGETDELTLEIRHDNVASIAGFSGAPCLAEIPYIPELSAPDPARRAEGWQKLAGLLRPLAALLFGPEAENSGLGALSGKPEGGLAPEALLDFDRQHLWHPYTSALEPLPVLEAVATSGPHILLRGGAKVLDGMSSWWAAIHGHNHPAILKALQDQARRMPHVMFGGLTHAPAVHLGKKLLDLAPDNLEWVFLADSGSVAVEVALKMALQYQQATGNPGKNRVLSALGGYHGDTLGAMSVCDPENGMHSLFSRVLPEQVFTARPSCRFDSPFDPASTSDLERCFREHGQDLAAAIIEPIVQGAGGMWFYHPEYLRRLKELCVEYGVLLILDEIATGFGRSGRLFACHWAGVEPDIMCLGKALTGGTMTLAATLASAAVARGISAKGGVFMHGPTFMANPLACSAALASLELLESSPWQPRVDSIAALLEKGLAPCRDLPGVADVRGLGAIGVLEMDRPVNVDKLQSFLVRECGVWLRPFGRLIYTMPPYICTEEEIRRICSGMERAVREGHW